MSEAATERPASGSPSAPAGGNFFQRKIGPLPVWGYAALAGLGALAWWYFRNHGTGAGQADTAASDTTGAVGDDVQGELSTIQSEIQQLQGENSTDGSSTGTTNSGSGTAKPAVRHVSTGKQSLNQIAKARNTSVAHILSVSSSGPESKDNLAKLEDWAKHPGSRRKGIVYYTSSGPVEGATA